MGKLTKDNGEPTHRLTDIVVEEVSIVDRPANQRPFLVVKRAEPEAGGTIVMNADGELVVGEGKVSKSIQDRIDELGTGETDAATPTKKAGAKMSKERMDQLEQAILSLVALKDSLTPETGPTAGSAHARKTGDDGATTKLLADVTKRLDSMVGSIDELCTAMKSQEKRINSVRTKVAKRSEPVCSNRIEVEKGKRPQAEPTTAWPMDLNREETPVNTPQHRSFFDD